MKELFFTDISGISPSLTTALPTGGGEKLTHLIRLKIGMDRSTEERQTHD
jgi:hypothetical protein